MGRLSTSVLSSTIRKLTRSRRAHHAERGKGSRPNVSACQLGMEGLEERLVPALVTGFDAPQDALGRWLTGGAAVPPSLPTGGPAPQIGASNFLRLTPDTPGVSNSVAFDRTDPGNYAKLVADFDFRITPGVASDGSSLRGNGLSFVLLNTSIYGDSGTVAPSANAQEPNFASSLAISLDPFQNTGEISNNHIGIHYDGQTLLEVDAHELSNHCGCGVDVAGGQWHHLRLVLTPGTGGGPAHLSLFLTPKGGKTGHIVEEFAIPGLTAYEARAYFAASTSAQTAFHDIDNINIQFIADGQGVFSFQPGLAMAIEGQTAVLTVHREGDLSSAASVSFRTEAGTASAGSDFTQTIGTLEFLPGETEKTVTVVLPQDAAVLESQEFFSVHLESPVGAVLGGPARTAVVVHDEERGFQEGAWNGVISLPNVAIHAVLLATGKVMSWDNIGHHPNLYDPVTNTRHAAAEPPEGHMLFCSAHIQLPDGRIFFAGGHAGHNGITFLGLPHASIYDPFTDTWETLPDMAHGRWYPTATMLADGSIVVMSGYDESGVLGTINKQIEVYRRSATGVWSVHQVDTSQDQAQNDAVNLGGLYPKSFLAPNGKVFVLGAGNQTWWLDVSASGTSQVWTPGPNTLAWHSRNDYGTGTIFAPGKILLTGGGAPSDMAEYIDLNESNPIWRSAGVLPGGARRQHNATLIPNGGVLITGGTRSPGFNDATSAVREAVLWRPPTTTGGAGSWFVFSQAEVVRVYHSIALLLPDGSVFTAGSGLPSGVRTFDQRNAERFLLPTWFLPNSPQIVAAPTTIGYGPSSTFTMTVQGGTGVTRVQLRRLGSITHSLDQGTAAVELSWVALGGNQYRITAPAGVTTASPGYYMLFVTDDRGAVSHSRMVQLATRSLSVSDATVIEGNSGTANALVTVHLSASSPDPVRVDYSTVAGTAQAGTDFVPLSGTLQFAPGETSKTIAVPVVGDLAVESTESFRLQLSNPVNATLTDAEATVTIQDTDVVSLPSLSLTDGQVKEGSQGRRAARFTLTLSQPSTSAVTISYQTVDGTAQAGSDYRAIQGTIRLAAGITSAVLPVYVYGDRTKEQDETFILRITDVQGAVATRTEAIGSIVNDDRVTVVSTIQQNPPKPTTPPAKPSSPYRLADLATLDTSVVLLLQRLYGGITNKTP